MNEIMKTYEIIAKVKTPIHVGIGDTGVLLKKQYYIDDKENKIYIFDFQKYIHKNQKYLKKYEEYLTGPKEFNQWIKEDMQMYLNVDILKKEYTIYSVDIGNSDIRGGEKKVSGNKKQNKSSNISLFVKNIYNQPYLPGSSMKGAIRTALLSGLLLNENNDEIINKNVSRIERFIQDKYSKDYNNIEIDYFNKLDKTEKKFDAVNDVFSYISISDSDPVDINSLILCEKVDVDNTGKEHGLKSVVVRECLKPDVLINFKITLMNHDKVFDIEKIIEMLKMHNEYYLRYFNKHFNLPLTSYTGLYIPIGGGSGYISKTVVEETSKDGKGAKRISSILDRLFHKHKHNNDYQKGFAPRLEKTTKYNSNRMLMGLLEIEKVFEPKTNKIIYSSK